MLPKTYFVILNNQAQLGWIIDHLKPKNCNAEVIGVLFRALLDSQIRGSNRILRYKNGKVDFGYVEKDYLAPTLSFRKFKKLYNSVTE